MKYRVGSSVLDSTMQRICCASTTTELLSMRAVRSCPLLMSVFHSFFLGEGNPTVRTVTFAELNESVRQYRAALVQIGVTKGDRVVGQYTERDFGRVFHSHLCFAVYLPNCPEALIICLATASLGAIFSSASADFGVLVRSKP